MSLIKYVAKGPVAGSPMYTPEPGDSQLTVVPRQESTCPHSLEHHQLIGLPAVGLPMYPCGWETIADTVPQVWGPPGTPTAEMVSQMQGCLGHQL